VLDVVRVEHRDRVAIGDAHDAGFERLGRSVCRETRQGENPYEEGMEAHD
jgi:hypothetical protein